MTHTKECNEYIEKCNKSVEDYKQKWPNYCKSCYGAGGSYFPGSYYSPPDFNECEDCIDKGKCPRCGAETFKLIERENQATDDIPQICSSCQFDLTTNSCMPEDGECICWDG